MFDVFPAVVRIFIVFSLVLAAIRFRWSLGSAFLGGAVVLGLIFHLPPVAILAAAFKALIDPKTLSLTVVVSLILVLSQSLEVSGQMARLLERFQGLLARQRLNIVIFPALIGLLPMPGGAIFSAPMVRTIGAHANLTGTQMSFINYWFRHLWEYWWPLYPGVLLTTNLAAIDLWTFVGALFPMSIVAAAAGYRPLRRMMPARPSGPEATAPERPRLRPFIRELTPVLIAIVPGIALGSLLEAVLTGPAATVSKELGLIVALCIAIGWVWHTNRLSAARRRDIVRRREMLAMIYMVTAILVFKGVLLDSRAVNAVSAELMGWRVPLAAIAVVLPLIVGLVVGITIAFVGSAFPILISLIAAYGATDQTLAYLMLAMTGGFVGVLLSPLHLCLVLSNQYFKADPVAVYRHLWQPCLVLILAAAGYFFLLV
ncbi:MAG: DUF401 family protein [Desulfobacterales bacterium]|jgi:hypothetical protein|nr:DUF401 family protein [Desulfobacteraceae bacterium]MDY0311040.1 DUF401 family protein [Desulfobacterales bacterium]